MRRSFHLLLAFLLAASSRSFAADGPIAGETLKAAVAKALKPLTQGAIGHRENRTCFACHNQGLPVLAMTTARQRGIAIDEDELKNQLQFIAEFLGKNRAGYLEGKGQGGQADTAGYALVTLELGGWKPDETTAAVTQFLLLRQADLEHWRANSHRPPSEGSHFTTSYVALRGLSFFRTQAQAEAFESRRRQVLQWLLKTPAKDCEDRVFRLRGLHVAGAEQKEIEAATKELAAKQRSDGGWAQLDGGEVESATQSDAYATGTALVALHQVAGVATSAPLYQNGVRFLLGTQREDGTWHVATRSKPIQKYFESGFPHGKDQFISSSATAWAATALAMAIEKPAAPATQAAPAPSERVKAEAIESGDWKLTTDPAQHQAVIALRGKPVATYVWQDRETWRPYFKSVTTPTGIAVTRPHPPTGEGNDHATMHPGIWLGFGSINGVDFWRNKGRVVQERFVPVVAKGEAFGFDVVNRYEKPDGELVCRQTCRHRFVADADGYQIVIDSRFTAEHALSFGVQEEMGLGVRVPHAITVKNGGAILSSAGGQNEKGTWGKVANWWDYHGKLDGRAVGLMVMSAAGNGEVWSHSRDYGVLVANPVRGKALEVKAGAELKRVFGVQVHEHLAADRFDRAVAHQRFNENVKAIAVRP